LNKKSDNFQSLLVYIIAIVIVFIAFFSSIVIFNYQKQSSYSQQEQELNQYHLPSVIFLGSMKNELNILLAEVTIVDVVMEKKTSSEQKDGFYDYVHVIDGHLTEYKGLFEKFKFSPVVESAFKRILDVHESLAAMSGSINKSSIRQDYLQAGKIVKNYLLRLEQLQRLHYREVSIATNKLSKTKDSIFNQIITFSAIALVICLLVIGRILIIIRRLVLQSRETQRELGVHREHLEELVAERTAKLEASNKELESYSYSIAHDLRSPLRSITSFSQIVLGESSDKLEKEQINYLTKVVNASLRMSNIIDEILELARLTRSELDKTSVDLKLIADSIMDSLQTVNKDDVELEWIVADDLVANADKTLITRLMENLLSNAWKYTANQEKRTIEFGKLDGTKESVFYIRDNGIGFDMQYIDKIFGVFERLHVREYEGTGIGLAIVERIIKRHQGRVWAESKLDDGATFYFSLPNETKIS